MSAGVPEPGRVDFGDLRRPAPIDRYFGYGRGTPVDRYYIEGFLRRHADDIRGRVLEIKDAGYTRALGGSRVTHSGVLDLDPENPAATLVADLTRADRLPADAYDCVICTQTLHFVFDVAAAVRGIARLLRPGGVALVTVPGISQSDRSQAERTGEFWRFTSASLRRLAEGAFPGGRCEVSAFGNVFAAVSFLHGIALEEVDPAELDLFDPAYEMLVAARCEKRAREPL